MDSDERLKEIAVAILNICLDCKRPVGPHIDDITSEFKRKSEAKRVLKQYLVQMDYVKKSHIADHYIITELGKNYLQKHSGAGPNLIFGDNTNYAVNSPGAVQSIDVTIYKKDVQIKINEMREAVQHNDRPKFLKALGYVLDKGVDVGIAVALAYAGVPK